LAVIVTITGLVGLVSLLGGNGEWWLWPMGLIAGILFLWLALLPLGPIVPRLLWLVRNFKRLPDAPFAIFVEPAMATGIDLSSYGTFCDLTLHKLQNEFDVRLPHRPALRVCAHEEMAGYVVGCPRLGVAFISSLRYRALLEEATRNGLARLVISQWAKPAHHFALEGLAMYCQGSHHARPNDMQALVALAMRSIDVSDLFDLTCFHGWRHWCQPLAGSLTGFLIRSFGLRAYRQFASRLRIRNEEECFRDAFQSSSDELWTQWREAISPMAAGFEPALTAVIAEERIREAYEQEEMEHCLSQAKPWLKRKSAPLMILYYAACAHQALHQHVEAVDLLRRLVAAPPQPPFVERNHCLDVGYLALGMSLDALGERQLALEAYRQARENVEPYHARSLRWHIRLYTSRPYVDPSFP
jgi:hypothetical protein